MKHTVTLYDTDIRQAINAYIEKHFPGFTASSMAIRQSASQRDAVSTEIEIGLGRPAQGKD